MSATSETSSRTEVIYREESLSIHRVVRRTTGRLPPLIYLAGPYTKPGPVQNTNRMIRIADKLLDLGVVPIVPHLTILWHLMRPRPYEQWLQYDLHVMLRCDAVLRVPGESNGADGEVRVARRLGIPVIYAESFEPDDCTAAVAAWLESTTEPANSGQEK